MKKSEQLDWLGSDVNILSSLVEENGQLNLPGRYMPDKKPMILSLEGVEKMTGEVRQRIVTAIRGEYRAREESQNAEKRSQKNSPEATRGGEYASTENRGGSPTPASSSVQEFEKSLFDTLLERKERAIQGLAAAEDNLVAAQEWHKGEKERLVEIELCIKALQKESPETSSTSEKQKD